MKIYIAGKISGDPYYKLKFQEAAYALNKQGHVALNPAELPEGMEPKDYMRICFSMIDSADAVYMLPDWTDSRGARLEAAYCQYIGKKILPKIGELSIVEYVQKASGQDDYNHSGLITDD